MSFPHDMSTRRPYSDIDLFAEDAAISAGLSVSALAAALGVSRRVARELFQDRRSLSPEMAVRLAVLFGESPEAWVGLPTTMDMTDRESSLAEDLQRLRAWHWA